MKTIGLISVIITGALLIFAERDFPMWGDPQSRPSTYLSPHYIEKSLEETAVPNVVTSVLADYRGFDTMFETAVIFTAGIAILSILRRRRKGKQKPLPAPPIPQRLQNDIIIQTAVRLLVPAIQLFALYVIAHGHHSPGGGFQGGVILASSLILISLAYDLKAALKRMSEKLAMALGSTGVLIYGGIGFLCLLLGANFLDYSALQKVLPATDAVMARSHGILGVEIGVAFTVMSILFAIYANLASNGEMDEGV